MASNFITPLQALDPARFGQTVEGKQTGLYFLSNGAGLTVAITNYGARIVGLFVKDKDGNWTDVVLGFDSLDGYLADGDYHGAIVGRYANRIAKGRFTLEGKEYTLATNNAPNHLHGGVHGFSSRVWDVVSVSPTELLLEYISADGEEGFPGTLVTQVRYTVTPDDALRISMEARTDKATPVNLTSHAYFNLNGQGSGSVLRHRLAIHATAFTPVDETIIPTGEMASVEGTPFDFRHPMAIGERIDEPHEQLKRGNGYDHNYVIDRTEEGAAIPVARATGDRSGIVLDVLTTEPGIQLYTGNFLSGTHTLKYGLTDSKNGAFCLETQHYPDSPNKPAFPSTILQPGKAYVTLTVFSFSLHE